MKLHPNNKPLTRAKRAKSIREKKFKSYLWKRMNWEPGQYIIKEWKAGMEANGLKQISVSHVRTGEFKVLSDSTQKSRIATMGDVLKDTPIAKKWAEGKALEEINKWSEQKMSLRRIRALAKGNIVPSIEEWGMLVLAISETKEQKVREYLTAILENAIKKGDEETRVIADLSLDTLIDAGAVTR